MKGGNHTDFRLFLAFHIACPGYQLILLLFIFHDNNILKELSDRTQLSHKGRTALSDLSWKMPFQGCLEYKDSMFISFLSPESLFFCLYHDYDSIVLRYLDIGLVKVS